MKESKPENALSRRKERKNGRGNSESADWGDCDESDILQLIAVVTGLGGTITFGYTRDGGAYYLSYFMDGEALKVFIRPTEDVELAIKSEIDEWKEEI